MGERNMRVFSFPAIFLSLVVGAVSGEVEKSPRVTDDLTPAA
jgi:hypothetical protein